MLLRAVFLFFLLSVLTIDALAESALFAKVALYDRALAYVPAAYKRGLASLPLAFVTGRFAPPTPIAPACISNDSPCTMFVRQTLSAPAQIPPANGTACSAPATNCAMNLQKEAIAESRLGLQLSTELLDANMNPLLVRTHFLTVRTFAVPPYFALAGERDATMGDRGNAPEGEDAGLPGGAGRDSTQIRVVYHDITGKNADTERDAWVTQGWSSPNGLTGWTP
ncbi:MAG: hypothetical protein NVS9B12_10150 [Vulcanimicrobiaceae bacterium]